MAEGGTQAPMEDEEIVRKLPSIPSADEVTAIRTPTSSRQVSIDERLFRLRAVTHSVMAAGKLRRASSMQGKYVAITPNERDNLEHIQHMTEDITARLERLRNVESSGQPLETPSLEISPLPSTQDPLYVPPKDVQGKFVELVPFDACVTRPQFLGISDSPLEGQMTDISPLPPIPALDTFVFMNGDLEGSEEDEESPENALATASIEQRLRRLSQNRGH